MLVPQVPPPTTVSTPMPSVVSELLKNATLVAPLPENSRLMHPKEDLSMVCHNINILVC